MTYEIERKILNNISLTDEEVSKFLNYICKIIRTDSGIIDPMDPMDPSCKVCNETSEKFGRLMLMRFGCDVDKIDIQKLLQIPLTHYANIISLNVNENRKTYLVDMTYSQFFGDTITLDNNTVISTKDTFGNIKEESFFKDLRQYGFVKLDERILKQYIDSFLDICEVRNRQIAYSNIEQLLINNKLNIKIKK